MCLSHWRAVPIELRSALLRVIRFAGVGSEEYVKALQPVIATLNALSATPRGDGDAPHS